MDMKWLKGREGGAIHPDPAHEGKVVGSSWDDDIVDGVIEDGNGTCNANDDKWLSGEEAEYDGAENGGQKHFIDTEGLLGLFEHVKGEGQGGQDTGVGKFDGPRKT